MFTIIEANPQASMRLFCFPYAGGGATIYHQWRKKLPSSVEIVGAHLPGRGTRLQETAFTRMTRMVEVLGEAIIPYLDKPFAFFGHSMGAVTGYELACWLRDQNYPQPVRLFVSGQRAPQLPNTDPVTYNLPDADFIRELSSLNGTPKEALAHPELMAIMLPLLRADFEVVETYAHEPKAPLDCPIIAFGGMQDDKVTREQLEAWHQQTTGPFSARVLPGDHFFLHSHQDLLLRMLSYELSRVAVNLGPPRTLVIH